MYHPTRGGVRGGRDQFQWDDVKVDKHRENYLGHSIKAPVGRWQKGKDLFWYARDKNSEGSDSNALKDEIKRIKEEEEQAMREALGLAPKRASRPQGNRLDKHEYAELVKRSSSADVIGAGHAEAAQVQGLGLYKLPCTDEEPSHASLEGKEMNSDINADPPVASTKELLEDSRSKHRVERELHEDSGRKRRHDDRREDKSVKHAKHHSSKERGHDKYEKKTGSDERKRHHKEKQQRKHGSDSK